MLFNTKQKLILLSSVSALITLTLLITSTSQTNISIAAPKNPFLKTTAQSLATQAATPQSELTLNTNLMQKMLLQKSKTHKSKNHKTHKSHSHSKSTQKQKKKRIIKIRKPSIDYVSESLCPFCKKYAVEVLSILLSTPDYVKLVNFRFIFWGNAKATYNQSLKKYEFECQHGEQEEYGDSMLTCANRLFPNKIALQYFYCMYGSLESFEKDFDKTNEYCLEGNTNVIGKIGECMQSKQGNKWFYEELVASPDNTYVPYVLFDKVHDREKQGIFKEDPFGFLCKMRYNQIKNKELCEKLTEAKR